MTERPNFLKLNHENGQTIISDFRKLSKEDSIQVDKWLLVNSVYGSLTWQEDCLYEWINDEFNPEEYNN